MDFFLSSDLYYSDRNMDGQKAQESFSESLVLFDSLGFCFPHTWLDGISVQDMVDRQSSYYSLLKQQISPQEASTRDQLILIKLVESRRLNEIRILLCPQHLPKFHPSFDSVLAGILDIDTTWRLVLVSAERKGQWRRTLERRWLASFGNGTSLLRQVVWLNSLSPNDYLVMLAVGDVMVDPFPFGGGVTSLEAFSVRTPVLTLPVLQTVPALTAGMLRSTENTLLCDILIQSTVEAYVKTAVGLLRNSSHLASVRKELNFNEITLKGMGTSNILEWEWFLKRIMTTV